uniref:Uncharacterized protein n=1 Tax=Anguilla anguilla TaxID=7936 RepID=A0A0E9QUU6_ANGAN
METTSKTPSSAPRNTSEMVCCLANTLKDKQAS